MATKLKSLKAGMLAGMAAEKTRSDAIDRFARAEAAISQHPNGLLQSARAMPPQSPAFSKPIRASSGSPTPAYPAIRKTIWLGGR